MVINHWPTDPSNQSSSPIFLPQYEVLLIVSPQLTDERATNAVVGIACINFRLHIESVEWNMGLTRKISTLANEIRRSWVAQMCVDPGTQASVVCTGASYDLSVFTPERSLHIHERFVLTYCNTFHILHYCSSTKCKSNLENVSRNYTTQFHVSFKGKQPFSSEVWINFWWCMVSQFSSK